MPSNRIPLPRVEVKKNRIAVVLSFDLPNGTTVRFLFQRGETTYGTVVISWNEKRKPVGHLLNRSGRGWIGFMEDCSEGGGDVPGVAYRGRTKRNYPHDDHRRRIVRSKRPDAPLHQAHVQKGNCLEEGSLSGPQCS